MADIALFFGPYESAMCRPSRAVARGRAHLARGGSPSHLAQWAKLAAEHGARVSPTLSPGCTHYLTDSCVDQRRVQAAAAVEAEMATLHWLAAAIKQGRLPRTDEHPLFMPLRYEYVPPECEGMLISATGFSVEDRETIVDMCHVLGIRFTGYFTKRAASLRRGPAVAAR